MSSEVEICNLALAHLGDSATVASIDPPEGSSQAEHCQRWYPIARNALLEMHEWGFATTRALLAEVVNPFPQWRRAYARPSDCLKVLAVLPADAASDSDHTALRPVPLQCRVRTIYTRRRSTPRSTQNGQSDHPDEPGQCAGALHAPGHRHQQVLAAVHHRAGAIPGALPGRPGAERGNRHQVGTAQLQIAMQLLSRRCGLERGPEQPAAGAGLPLEPLTWAKLSAPTRPASTAAS
jgi:hypothetical protein